MLVLKATTVADEDQGGSLEGIPNKEVSTPRIVTSRRRIVYKKSSWNINGFEIRSGELECRAVVLSMDNSLLIWLGSGKSYDAELGEISLGVPAPDSGRLGAGGALATPLLGAAGGVTAAARRLAAAARRPVYVCSALPHDRFTTPLIEQGLAQIKNKLDLDLTK